jgi:hypothetical protein
MKQSNISKPIGDIAQFYEDHKKTQKHEKNKKCPMADKNCKNWDITKQICMRGWCGI